MASILSSAGAANRGGASAKPKGFVFNIMRFCVHDGPGIRTTVFFKGCPLDCWWCHNPESRSSSPEMMYSSDRCMRCGSCVEACPNHAIAWNDAPVWDRALCRLCGDCVEACPTGARQIVGRWMTVEEVLEEVKRDTAFFDESDGGVTLSGGEPLMQPEFVESLLRACRANGIHTAIETCGVTARNTLLRISELTDLFLFDLKLMDPAKHREYTGAANDFILANLQALVKKGAATIVRIPLIPGVNDDCENIDSAVEFLSSIGIHRVDLLPYHEIGIEKYKRLGVEYRLRGLKPPTPAQMEQISERFKKGGFAVREGG